MIQKLLNIVEKIVAMPNGSCSLSGVLKYPFFNLGEPVFLNYAIKV